MSDRARVLVADDDRALVDTVVDALSDAGYAARGTGSSVDAARILETEGADALVTDLRMPQIDGLGLLALSRRLDASRPVIVMTAYSAVDSAVESIRMGAYHYLTKPFKTEELLLFLERALGEARLADEARSLRRQLGEGSPRAQLIGRQRGLAEVCALVSRLADADAPVLVLGETGVGKGLVVRALHHQGRRAPGPLVTVNCAALPEPLLESEVFGHARGAFTGATSSRRGLLEEASGGTLFLDEIGDLALPLQAKLLHVLEHGVVRAVGSNREVQVDVRFVAATHRDLKAMAAGGKFREDLLFRLDVVSIEIPPLRERALDIPELALHFLQESLRKHPRAVARRFSEEAVQCLVRYAWPGNVRELEHTVERSVLLVPREVIDVGDLPQAIGAAPPKTIAFTGPVLTLDELERRYASWALDELGGRRMLAAEQLGIDRKTLAKLLGGS